MGPFVGEHLQRISSVLKRGEEIQDPSINAKDLSYIFDYFAMLSSGQICTFEKELHTYLH